MLKVRILKGEKKVKKVWRKWYGFLSEHCLCLEIQPTEQAIALPFK
jgi:hypothetical protein